jgi:2Fe-2S ferredoxin
MVALYDHFKGEPWGDCGGSCICATCHVVIEKGYELFGEKTDESEVDLLDYAPDMIEGKSRLGCQCELRDIPDKSLVVKVTHID